jgi:WD40 repeat protein
MADVFISYSRSDTPFVGALADGLRARGKDVWIDIEGIRDAEVFPEALRNAIDASDGFVFVISAASVKSSYCMREVGDAVDAGKRIVPIDLEHVPDDDVPEPIRVRNWIPAEDDLETTVERVVRALDTDLDHVKAHTHWEQRAREWDGKERDPSLLLRGSELAEAEAWLASAETRDPPPVPLQREYFTASRQAAANRQRRVAIIAVVVALISVALLVFAVIQRSQAQSARTTNESRAVAFASEAQDAVDPERALLLAMAAAKARATPDSLFALRRALDSDPLLHRFSFGAQNCPQPAPSVSFDPSGVLAVGLCSGRVVLFGSNYRELREIKQGAPAAPLRFSRDGSTLAVAAHGLIGLYDPHTLAPIRDLTVPGYPQRIVYSGDGSRLAATSATLKRAWVSVWDSTTGRLTMRRSLPGRTSALTPLVRGIGFVNGSLDLAVGSPVGPVQVFASDGGRLIHTLPDKEDALLGFDPDGRWIAVAGYHTRGPQSGEGVVTLWDAWVWRSHVVAAEPGLRPRNLFISPDATRIAVGWSDGSAAIYSLFLNSQLARFLGPTKPVSALAYSPDSQRVVVGAGDGSVRVWRAGGAERSYTEVGSRINWDLPAVSNQIVTVVTPPNIVRRLSVPSLDPLGTWRIPLPRHASYTYAWLSPSGDTAVFTRSDGRADVWSRTQSVGSAIALPSTLSPVVGDSSRLIASVPALPTALAAVSSDDKRMIVLDGEHNELVDLRTGVKTPISQRARHCRGQWHAAKFSADGRVVVGGATCGELLEWNAHSGKLIRRYTLPGQIAGMALTHDGRTAATASPDGGITLTDLVTGSQRAIAGAPRGINSLDFGADGRTLAAGVDDATIRIWDVASGRQLRQLQLQTAPAPQFTPNGRELLASQLTGALSFFEPCPGCGGAKPLLAAAAQRATRQLTPAEKKTYLSGF